MPSPLQRINHSFPFSQQTFKHLKFAFLETEQSHSFQPFTVYHLCKIPCSLPGSRQNTSLLQLRPYKCRTEWADEIPHLIFASFVKFDADDLCWVSDLKYTTVFLTKSLSHLLVCICSVSYSLNITLSLLICHHFFIRLFLQFVMLILNFNPVQQYFCGLFSLIPMTESLKMMKGEEQDTQSG